MPARPYDRPLWSILYPKLLDKEYLMQAYARCKSQAKTAKELGCGEHSVRMALKYHGLKKPFAFVSRKD